MSKAKFPQKIYVTREGDKPEDQYLLGHEEVGYIDEPQACAVYQLVKVGRVEVLRSEFVEDKKRPT